jgi:hypothetical protein
LYPLHGTIPAYNDTGEDQAFTTEENGDSGSNQIPDNISFADDKPKPSSITSEEFIAMAHTFTGSLNPLEISHLRWGCIGENTLKTLFPTLAQYSMRQCKVCMQTNATRAPVSTYARKQPKRQGQFLEADGIGKMRTPGLNGEKYIFNILDTFLGSADTRSVSKKSDFTGFLKHIVNRNDRRGIKSTEVRLDAGGENISREIKSFLYEKGIEAKYAAPQIHSSIGGVESYGGRQMRMCRATMAHGGAPAKFLFLAAENFSVIQKLLPRGNKTGSSPDEMEHGIIDPHILSGVKTLFCEAWHFENPENRSSRGDKHLVDRAVRCVLVKNALDVKDGVFLLSLRTERVFTAGIHTKYDETVFPLRQRSSWQNLRMDYDEEPRDIFIDSDDESDDDYSPDIPYATHAPSLLGNPLIKTPLHKYVEAKDPTFALTSPIPIIGSQPKDDSYTKSSNTYDHAVTNQNYLLSKKKRSR